MQSPAEFMGALANQFAATMISIILSLLPALILLTVFFALLRRGMDALFNRISGANNRGTRRNARSYHK